MTITAVRHERQPTRFRGNSGTSGFIFKVGIEFSVYRCVISSLITMMVLFELKPTICVVD